MVKMHTGELVLPFPCPSGQFSLYVLRDVFLPGRMTGCDNGNEYPNYSLGDSDSRIQCKCIGAYVREQMYRLVA